MNQKIAENVAGGVIGSSGEIAPTQRRHLFDAARRPGRPVKDSIHALGRRATTPVDNIGPNAGAGTRPLGGDYVSPDYVSPTGDAEDVDTAKERADADAAQARDAAFAALVDQVKIDNAMPRMKV